jgi:hypothetical protein
MLNTQGDGWVKYPTFRRYIAIAQTDTWVTVVAVNETGQTILEIPPGKDQPAEDSPIRKDLQTLNAGETPQDGNKVIIPPIPGWKSFISGTDYGLALTTDGRVFGVGTNKVRSSLVLSDRYTKIVTAMRHGWVANSRYCLGIRAANGSIAFAGYDPDYISDDIIAAQLTHVVDIAAGPNRAVAITQDGGIRVFGKNNWYGDAPPQQHPEGPYTAISASILPTGNCVFLASVAKSTP